MHFSLDAVRRARYWPLLARRLAARGNPATGVVTRVKRLATLWLTCAVLGFGAAVALTLVLAMILDSPGTTRRAGPAGVATVVAGGLK